MMRQTDFCPSRGCLLLFVFLLRCSNPVTCKNVGSKIFVYSYTANLTEDSRPDRIIQKVKAQVSVTPYLLNPVQTQTGLIGVGKKLLHIEAIFKDHNPEHKHTKIEAVAEFKCDGLLQKLHIPTKFQLKITDTNIFKGIVSLFIINENFEAGHEIDSSGACQVVYAAVDNIATEYNHIIIDKQKRSCKQLQKPLDVWRYNLLPTTNASRAKQMYVRYKINAQNNYLMHVMAHEGLSISTFSELDGTEVRFDSWQELELVEVIYDDRKAIDIEEHMLLDPNEVAVKITGSPNTFIHLTPGFPLKRTTEACSLNFQLFDTALDNVSQMIRPRTLQEAIELARNDLQAEQVGNMQPLHVVLQLTQLLRCLPNHPSAVDLLIDATSLSPPAIDARLLYRQHDSWRDQLVEVLIGCGTPTCISVVLKRLEALTEAAVVNQPVEHTDHPEIELARKMLFDKLWPALSYMRQPTSETYGRMIACCQPVVILMNQVICLTTLSNLWPYVLNKEDNTMRRSLIDLVEKFLIIDSQVNASPDDLTDNHLETDTTKNSRLIVGLAIARKLKATELINLVAKIALDSVEVFPTVEATAIRTLVVLSGEKQHFKLHGSNVEVQLQKNNIKTNLIGKLLKAPARLENDLLVGQALFNSLLELESSAKTIGFVLKELAKQKRWPLVRVCRLLIADLCANEVLSIPMCNCLGENASSDSINFILCDLGAAGGWSGLSIKKESMDGQATFILGDLFNLNDSLIVNYELQLFNGIEGELISSNLLVNLLNADGEGRLFEFNINTNGLDAFAPSLNLISLTSSSSIDSVGWLNVGLKYLDTILPPWTVFSGGLSDLIQSFWSTLSTPTALLQVLRPVLDERQYRTFAAGWTLITDTFGLMSLELTGAVDASVWTQSGRSLIRTRLGVTNEVHMYVVDETEQSSSALIQGFGGEVEFDFITRTKVFDLPEGICMSMSRSNDMRTLRWEAVHSVTGFQFTRSKKTSFSYRDLMNSEDYHILHSANIPGVSYDLGLNNTLRCNRMSGRNLW
ncbi:Microsomal triglyceride transfer protein large subunit [Paragonimus skrjabini miyazakii]|uniref:Microsomal triglyceride transfer protein large subunit n=1 Tax=Paragonimus skrjabini miyazakii TaxID=59628 RepID=A0A8S9Z977_9TREM|nr:Microsomal triglyceride transfer protein large subunit [Paragonimus skrjabini miyazakii]